MEPSKPITIHSLGPSISAGARFFQRINPQPPSDAEPSDLLKSIRAALQGSGTEQNPPFRRCLFPANDDGSGCEEELAWNEHTVVHSAGGVLKRKWSFEEEGQNIQWACVGWLLQPGMVHSGYANSAARYTSDHQADAVSPTEKKNDETFSPFYHAKRVGHKTVELSTMSRGFFVFLRSFGKILLMNGLEHTFALPFIVRQAWPIHPHGVIIQRVLDRAEIEEAEVTGDFTLPTLFTITNPFSEPRAVGVTEGITGGFGFVPPVLKDKKSFNKPLKSLPADQHVLWVSNRQACASDDLMVTIDGDRRTISVWHYVYLAPKDIPVPIGRARARSLNRKRTSLANVLPSDVRHTTVTEDMTNRADRMMPPSPGEELEATQPAEFSRVPGIATSLSKASTLVSMGSIVSIGSQWVGSGSSLPHRVNSLTRNEITAGMDRMVLGRRSEIDGGMPSVDHGRMNSAYWVEKMFTYQLDDTDSKAWKRITFSVFDYRYDGKEERSYLAICLPGSERLFLWTIAQKEDTKTLKAEPAGNMPAVAAVSIKSMRENAWDLLLVKPGNELALLTHGLNEVPLESASYDCGEADGRTNDGMMMAVDTDGDRSMASVIDRAKIVSLMDAVHSCATVVFEDGSTSRISVNLVPLDVLTKRCLASLATSIPKMDFFQLHKRFLELWDARDRSSCDNVEFECFVEAFHDVFQMRIDHAFTHTTASSSTTWGSLGSSKSHQRLYQDTALSRLKLPEGSESLSATSVSPVPHKALRFALISFHTLGEDLRILVHRQQDLRRLAPLICRIARIVRPEWADYWKRLCPDACSGWIAWSPHIDEIQKIPAVPVDYTAKLYAKIHNTDAPVTSVPDFNRIDRADGVSFAYGRSDPFIHLHEMHEIYKQLSDTSLKDARRRAEAAILQMVKSGRSSDFLNLLPLGLSAPLREAARTCQLCPPPDWPVQAYEFVGRSDLSEGAVVNGDLIFDDGYRSVKDHLNRKTPRRSYQSLFDESHKAAHGDEDGVTGVELNLADFTEIRFGQDRRLQEVARMLRSSHVPSIKMTERPELSEHDLAKEQQNQVLRTAERTLALPIGRAIFTFGSVPVVTREVYAVPKIELSVRLQPQNTVISPEPGKIPPESLHWAEFHNGVAAGLRISPSSGAIDSSWIAFNKPNELTPEHAGFLFGLGLTGHLREMLTWHTFGYLTPKHDLTSIGVLLGLSAANVGTSNRHVTKLLAVHTPALLPTQAVDLNVPLLTQAAGLVGIGLLYMGTKNRRMAEVALHQISRKDLFQPDLSNEHREAYTVAAALSFGMIMLARGSVSTSPADLALLSRLRVLIHGEGPAIPNGKVPKPSFDINLTSPAATVALGLMYLKTERKDVADIITIPDTVLALNQMQPSFLLVRTLARALIMWEAIRPTKEWLYAQIPEPILTTIEGRISTGAPIDDAIELAYYHILSGCCFAIALKYAGTAREEAYMLIIGYHDMFTRIMHTGSLAFDHKIKRQALRDGLNVITLSLNMIMAGTGEINCLRRLRFAHGMYNAPVRYGSHMATHMSLGLLFLGGGRFTLGTSNAAIASMVTAFYPRFPGMSSDNKGHLQALRHLWVLAVEPRCLIARDVDTKEVVYLPMKIKVKEGPETAATQFISPSLIPGLERLLSIKVDTPRYWPFFLDIANNARHRECLLRSQTLYVKRRTAFLSYLEDPKGSRSLFVRSGNSTGDAATLDFPQLSDAKAHPAGDLQHFITSYSNDMLFVAFADRLCREDGATHDERIFNRFCHAALLDCIIQDKPQILSTHLQLYRIRNPPVPPNERTPGFPLQLQDVRFLADFYGRVYDRRFSGRGDTQVTYRPPLLRESTLAASLRSVDSRLQAAMGNDPAIRSAVQTYARSGDIHNIPDHPELERYLGWYLLRHGVPPPSILSILRRLAVKAHADCTVSPPPMGIAGGAAESSTFLDQAVKTVLHSTGSQMAMPAQIQGWSVQSLDDVLDAWKGQERDS
ncbi:hypothetical protein BD410DRAFT_741006 [Rickenella mellea]|uniref:Uncharacterized protein n=1 Tax=Rickenella mellea TaxID=50990 RepID=A0A4Y7QI48_9AGAM|nr:hypothetical protein BD410DRAFT_741006 [Rickenella mellea]